MSNYAPFQCWIMFVAPFIFHQSVKADFWTKHQDRDRVLVTYNTNTDPCFKLSTYSTHEAKEAANSACSGAFLALDRLKGNSCERWKRPKCRQLQLPEFDFFECSCKISSVNYYDVRSDVATPFRECAWRIYADEIFYGSQGGDPSANYQRTNQQIYDRAVQKSRLRHASYIFPEAVPSYNPGSGVSPATPSNADQGPHVCHICGHIYATRTTLRYHVKSHDQNLQCQFCKIPTFSNRGNYNSHMRRFHANLEGVLANTPPDDKPKGPHICYECGKHYQRRTSLAAHMRVHREQFRCYDCNIEFSTKSNYKKHMQRRHPEIAQIEEEEARALEILAKKYACERCGSRFSSKKVLRQHNAVHRGETHCQKCNLTFARKDLLKRHNRDTHS